jgi:hypothetical protein
VLKDVKNENKKLSFVVENAELVKENPKSNFSIISLDFFASGPNKHRIYVSRETLLKNADTIKNAPLVWMYDPAKDDAYTHDKGQIPCGFVPEKAEIVAKELPDGRTMLNTIAYCWKRFSGRLLEYFRRDGEKPISVEMEVFDSKDRDDGFWELLDYKFEAVAILGNLFQPAIPLAHASVLQFSDEYKEALKEFSEEDNLITFPYSKLEDANPAILGIDPKVTLEQANSIARAAESIGSDENKNGWAIAISQFKKSHKVVDGRWVKKEQAEMSDEGGDPESEESGGKDKDNPEEEAKEVNESCESEMPQAEMGCGEEKSMNFELDFSVILALFEPESEPYKLVFAESEKPNEERDYKIIFDNVLGLLGTKDEKIKQSGETITALETEKVAFSTEIGELRSFKASIEKQQKDFAVDSTLKEVEKYVPKEELDILRESSANYTLETINAWKNEVKATAFAHSVKEDKKPNDIVRMQLPFAETKKVNSPWK